MKSKMKQLELHLSQFKVEADKLLNSYASEKKELADFLEDGKSKYTAEYLKEYRENWQPSHDYVAILNDLREEYKPIIDGDLAQIQERLDALVLQNPDPAYAAKIQAYYAMGMANSISPAELEGLRRQAKSYSELKMLQQLAASRTKTENQVKIDDKGQLSSEQAVVKNPYDIQIPNAEEIYKRFADYSGFMTSVIDTYVGEDFSLIPHDESVKFAFAAAAQGYFEKGGCVSLDAFLKNIEPLTALQPAKKETLSERDERFLALITNYDEYSALAPGRAIKIAKEFPDIMEMMRLDKRFKSYMPKDEAVAEDIKIRSLVELIKNYEDKPQPEESIGMRLARESAARANKEAAETKRIREFYGIEDDNTSNGFESIT